MGEKGENGKTGSKFDPLSPALFLAAAMAVLFGIFFVASFIRSERPNLPAPTLGGMQVWADQSVRSGWRIQQNVITGHYRLLDPESFRRAWGTFEETKEAFHNFETGGKVAPPPADLVLLVHGLGGWGERFYRLRDRLEEAGYAVEHINYPSSLRGIFAHAEQIDRILERMKGVRRITFISHSMGGLVMRLVLAGDANWRARIEVDGLVMIGVPNHGAVLADRLIEDGTFGELAPEAIADLRAGRTRDLPPVTVRYCLIAGSTKGGRGTNPLIPGDDDGMVALAEVRLKEDDDLLVIDSDHLRMINHPATIAAVLRFLEGRGCAGD